MNQATFSFPSVDGTEIHVYKWTPDTEVKGIVQIAHGMAEHAGRYSHFAEALTGEGYAVYANDHRGHGRTAGQQENLLYFADENGWELVLEDMHQLSQLIKREHPGLPLFLLGHSMGSFLARSYIQQYGGELSGVLLSGTGGTPGILGYIGTALARMEIRNKGRKGKSALLTNLTFGNYNKAFQPARTEYDWLSRDSNEVDKYIHDPYCGGMATAGFYADMLTGIQHLDKPERLGKIPEDLPIFLFSGDKDPVGNNSRGVLQTYRNFRKAGVKDVSCKLYPGGRHEMLNEINKAEVYRDVIDWLNKHI
ncbi:alpha/beta hydrolase [Effusibacillus lacus]|uniref:Alpha/beta hydrolase n=1 Tax=Effusibacillus lacus TaxID=1348429 RepID=A0A292YP95_9BACL|nr:alpha/beta hydrolase [Effusibacillus lacus]TCS68171.1 alpha-beta hydrolase superfamily lysophospholipase [Effusibacillus lacus]GAX90300.1 alpha/beta hydrolase [Effusibacillus lacus]